MTAVLAVAALTLSGCSANVGGASSASPSTADVAAATSALKTISDAPSAFPVSEPLIKSPAGKKVALIDCGTPSCSLFVELARPAAEKLGIKATVIQSGQSADGVASALDTVLSGGYDGVFVAGLPFPLWQAKADQLKKAGVSIVTTGITGVDDSVGASIGADAQSKRAGAYLADWTIVNAKGPTSAVIYETPELPFTGVVAKAFTSRLKELCAGCGVRTVDIPVADIGNKAPSDVVDDLSAHPETKAAAFAIGEQALGLPQALKTAGITDVATITNGPTPAQLTDVKNGDISATLSADWAVMVWTAIDALSRLMTGEPQSHGTVDDLVVQQLLTADNLSGDLSKGWSGYPEFAERFGKLWSQAK